MKAIMVDGPHHGTTIHLEQEPQRELIMPSQIAFSVKMYKALDAADVLPRPNHKYRLCYITHFAKSAVYEYVGQT
jgi:hypothetical protein